MGPAKQSRLIQVRYSGRSKYGFYQVPKSNIDAVRVDEGNGNTKWQDAIDIELAQINEYNVFQARSKAVFVGRKVINAPVGYRKIKVHVVFDVKHYGRHKASPVADGHLSKEARAIRSNKLSKTF